MLTSHEPYFLEYQKIGAEFKYIRNMVLDLLLILKLAYEASTYALMINSFPNAIGALAGINSVSDP